MFLQRETTKGQVREMVVFGCWTFMGKTFGFRLRTMIWMPSQTSFSSVQVYVFTWRLWSSHVYLVLPLCCCVRGGTIYCLFRAPYSLIPRKEEFPRMLLSFILLIWLKCTKFAGRNIYWHVVWNYFSIQDSPVAGQWCIGQWVEIWLFINFRKKCKVV